MRTLAIETSCDDTCLAVVTYSGGSRLVEELVAFSQISVHQQYGGVVPEIAARSHADKILMLLDELQLRYKQKHHYNKEEFIDSIDCISVTAYPGLPGALVVGVTTAYTLGTLWSKTVVEVHHILGHVFSVLLDRKTTDLQLPYLAMTVSGGHNDIYLVKSLQDKKSLTVNNEQIDDTDQSVRSKRAHMSIGETIKVGEYHIEKIAQTMDDAAGELFDKVARMLGGPYPGGKRISDCADKIQDDGEAIKQSKTLGFRAPVIQDGQFSCSGIKSQVYNYLRSRGGVENVDDKEKSIIAYAFQQATVKHLIKGLEEHLQQHSIKTVGLVGGVSANTSLREAVLELTKNYSIDSFLIPARIGYCTDNAAMIGVVGLLEYRSKNTI